MLLLTEKDIAQPRYIFLSIQNLYMRYSALLIDNPCLVFFYGCPSMMQEDLKEMTLDSPFSRFAAAERRCLSK